MADLGNMTEFIKVKKELKGGDVITIVDAGEIKDVDFSMAKDGSKTQKVFQAMVELPTGTQKILTFNKTSLKILQQKLGSQTEKWVGTKLKVTFPEMMNFGEMKPTLVLKPLEAGNPAEGLTEDKVEDLPEEQI